VISVQPDPFELVPFDASEIASIAERIAKDIGIADDVEIDIEVDEELFAPLTGSTSDVVAGRAKIWISGASLEDALRPLKFDPERAEAELGIALFRIRDRLDGTFAEAPVDDELDKRFRSAWDTFAEGRVAASGGPTKKPRRLYDFRLYNGFTDVADSAFHFSITVKRPGSTTDPTRSTLRQPGRLRVSTT
jgi:hypothetical protein